MRCQVTTRPRSAQRGSDGGQTTAPIIPLIHNGRRLAVIRALLLDADGVLQSIGSSFTPAVHGWTAHEDKQQFAAALSRAEAACLCGESDFAQLLPAVLAEWGSRVSVAEVLQAWHDIQVDATMFPIVAAVRARGTLCCVASNQQSYRARHMSQVLGYHALFDREFYSHVVGAAKPDAQYFSRVLHALDLAPADVLFIDDNRSNVYAASTVGIWSEHFPPHSGGSYLRELLTKHGVPCDG